jgi:hypothetical protein
MSRNTHCSWWGEQTQALLPARRIHPGAIPAPPRRCSGPLLAQQTSPTRTTPPARKTTPPAHPVANVSGQFIPKENNGSFDGHQ